MKVLTFLVCQMSITRMCSPTWMTDDLHINLLWKR